MGVPVPEHQPLTPNPRFLQTAEMVKPSTPSPSHESSSSSGSDEGTEYYPHLGERSSGAGGVGRGGMRGKNQEHWGSGELGGRKSRVAAPSSEGPTWPPRAQSLSLGLAPALAP